MPQTSSRTASDLPAVLAGGRVRFLDATVDRIDAALLDELRRHAETGGAVVIVAGADHEGVTALSGVRALPPLPRTEWFVTMADRPEAARLEREVPVMGALRELTVVGADVEVAATTSVAFRHRPVLAVRRVGDGRVLTTGLDDLDALFGHRELGRYLARLLRSAAPNGAAGPAALGLAVVGYGPFGGMGHLHGMAATETEGLRFVAAADPVADRLQVAAADFPGLHTYADAAGVAADSAVDIAVVATPPAHHAALAIALLDAGKHVVVEKPMCLTVAEADAMLHAAAANDRVLTVHQSRRWDADFRTLQHAVEGGLAGEVFNIETFVGSFEHPCRAWHSEESVSGGAVYDWGSHHIDWIIRLFGAPPARVSVASHKRVWHDVTNADQVSVAMYWDDGREATFRQSDVAAVRRPKFYVQGTAATIEGHYRPVSFEAVHPGRGYVQTHAHHAEAPVALRLVRYESNGGLVEQHLPLMADPAWGFHRNLADHLLLGEALAVPPQQSRAVVAVLEAAQQAGNHGFRHLELPALDLPVHGSAVLDPAGR